MEGEMTLNDVFKLIVRVENKLDRVLGQDKNKFVPRTKIVKEIGRRSYDQGVKKGILNPVKNNGARNSKAKVIQKEYEYYKSTLKI
jgi:hypothetical protein